MPRSQTITDPIARRDELVKRQRTANITYTAEATERQKAEAMKNRLAVELHQLKSDSAFGNAKAADVAAKEVAVAEAEADFQRHLSAGDAALNASRALELALMQLYGEEFATFAEEADQKSKEADAAVGELAFAFRKAVMAWKDATEAWAPLCRAVRLSGVRPFPLHEFAMADVLNGACNPRPDGIEILRDA